jgi:uncharacterized membrane protein YgcG
LLYRNDNRITKQIGNEQMNKRIWTYGVHLGLGVTLLGGTFMGCAREKAFVPSAPPLGAEIDPIFQDQEINAEASKYVIYMHEFELNRAAANGVNLGGWRLNDDGEDHLKQIAVNVKAGHMFPVVLERSRTSSKAGTEYGYPVHLSDELDSQRRQIVVEALGALGVQEAETLVIVAPAFAEGYTSGEAARAYHRGLSTQQSGGFGRGGGGGGGGGGRSF